MRLVVLRCTESELGGRMIDASLTNTILPNISREFLGWMMGKRAVCGVEAMVINSDFKYFFPQVENSWEMLERLLVFALPRLMLVCIVMFLILSKEYQ